MKRKNAIVKKSKKLALSFFGLLVISGFFCSCRASRRNSVSTNDTPEVWEFVCAEEATERDLEVFDILRINFEDGCLEQEEMGYSGTGSDGGEKNNQRDSKQKLEEAKAYVDAFREKLVSGKWPQDDPLLPEPEYSSSPQLWVRIAELSQDYLEKETGEQWRVLSLTYPYLDVEWDYIIPIQEERSKDDALVTSLICESGQDAGMTADVSYYRWADEAYFASDVEEQRQGIRERRDMIEQIEASGLLGGRRYAIDGHYKKKMVYVWSSGEDDPWRDPEEFSKALAALSKQAGMEDMELNLVEKDAPVFISRYEKMEAVPSDKAPNAIVLDACRADSFEFAPADLLFSQEIWGGDAEDPGTLLGYLAPDRHDPLYHWHNVVGNEVYGEKESLTSIVAGQLGAEEDQVIALPGEDRTGSHYVHVILPRGILPETPGEVGDTVRELQHVLWRHIFTDAYKEDLYTVFLYVYVINDDELTGPEGAADFTTLHRAVMEDSSGIESFEAPMLLRAHMSCHAYDREVEKVEEGWVTEYKIDLEGPLTESREWYRALAEEQ